MNNDNNFSIQKLINDEVRKDRKPREIKSWHPSKMGMCLTGVYLERLGVEPDTEFDERTLRVFAAGKFFEDWVVSLLEKSGRKIEKQIHIEWPEYDVSGYVDLLVDDLPYEIKTKHSRAFWYMVNKGEGANKHHMMQLWLYLERLNKPEGRLLYISKDDLMVQEYIVDRNDEDLASAVIGELETLNDAWEKKLPPEPIKNTKDWRVKYCRWHSKCVSQGKYS